VSFISPALAKSTRLKTLRLEENCLALSSIPTELLKESNVSLLALEGNLFAMKEFMDVDGYETVSLPNPNRAFSRAGL
jgi:hypothetical protein